LSILTIKGQVLIKLPSAKQYGIKTQYVVSVCTGETKEGKNSSLMFQWETVTAL